MIEEQGDERKASRPLPATTTTDCDGNDDDGNDVVLFLFSDFYKVAASQPPSALRDLRIEVLAAQRQQ